MPQGTGRHTSWRDEFERACSGASVGPAEQGVCQEQYARMVQKKRTGENETQYTEVIIITKECLKAEQIAPTC